LNEEAKAHKVVIREIIDRQVQDVIKSSANAIASAGVQSADKVRKQPTPLICCSHGLLHANREPRKFLYRNVYYHPCVSEVNRYACEMLREVFEVYAIDPDQLGDQAARRVEQERFHRTVCDYVAGMSDRFLLEEHKRLVESRAVSG
jgi:dGTPase